MTDKVSSLHESDGAMSASTHIPFPRRHISPVILLAFISLFIASGYAIYQRAGTSANADTVEFSTNLRGGFLAIGMTPQQPGFLILSKLDKKKVSVHTVQSINRVTGTHTIVDIESSQMKSRSRLRGPKAFIINDAGHIESVDLAWSVDEFLTARRAVDCSTQSPEHKKSCGRPFTDLHNSLESWKNVDTPSSVEDFLLGFVDKP